MPPKTTLPDKQTRAYELLELVAIFGEFPNDLLQRISGGLSYKETIITNLKQQGFIKTHYADGLRGLRLTNRAKKLLLADNPERFAFYMDENSDTNHVRSEPHRRERLYRIAGATVTMQNAGVAIFRDERPAIFTPTWEGGKHILEPSFYSAREIKEIGFMFDTASNTRITGVLLTETDVFITYNMGNSIIQRWSYKTEMRAKAVLDYELTEIRTGEDKDTENEGPDIYCSFYPPILKQDAALLSKMKLGCEDIPFDLVIMAPEMLIPTRAVGAGLPKIKVYAVIEDCIVDGEEHPTKRVFADPKHAEIVMRQLIHRERESGCISEWKTKHFFVEEQYSEQYYTAYYKNEYCFNHYTIYVEEVELSLSVPFAEQMLSVSLGVKYREDIAEQIFPWEISEEVRRTSVNDPALYAMVASSLEKNERYQEEYAEVIAEVAHKLTAEHSKIEEMLKKAKSEGKL